MIFAVEREKEEAQDAGEGREIKEEGFQVLGHFIFFLLSVSW